jgi:hypothetical protein
MLKNKRNQKKPLTKELQLMRKKEAGTLSKLSTENKNSHKMLLIHLSTKVSRFQLLKVIYAKKIQKLLLMLLMVFYNTVVV